MFPSRPSLYTVLGQHSPSAGPGRTSPTLSSGGRARDFHTVPTAPPVEHQPASAAAPMAARGQTFHTGPHAVRAQVEPDPLPEWRRERLADWREDARREIEDSRS